MKKKNFISALAIVGVSMLMVSCGSAREYLITSGSENLQALTKITDNTGQTVSKIGVAPNSPTIFLAIWDGSSQNIYKKDNPTSASMSQITSGNVNGSVENQWG